jgi:hypothetical protein
MNALTVIILCLGCAVLGRLLLTRDEAWRTITVRVPALFKALVLTAFALLFWLVLGALCFAAGSVYGLAEWWWPSVLATRDDLWLEARPVISGRW